MNSAQPIFDFLAKPLANILHELGEERRFIYTDLTEVFFTQVKVAAFGALCMSFPIIASQIWAFIAPGLYRNEKNAFLPFLIATPVMFLAILILTGFIGEATSTSTSLILRIITVLGDISFYLIALFIKL